MCSIYFLPGVTVQNALALFWTWTCCETAASWATWFQSASCSLGVWELILGAGSSVAISISWLTWQSWAGPDGRRLESWRLKTLNRGERCCYTCRFSTPITQCQLHARGSCCRVLQYLQKVAHSLSRSGWRGGACAAASLSHCALLCFQQSGSSALKRVGRDGEHRVVPGSLPPPVLDDCWSCVVQRNKIFWEGKLGRASSRHLAFSCPSSVSGTKFSTRQDAVLAHYSLLDSALDFLAPPWLGNCYIKYQRGDWLRSDYLTGGSLSSTRAAVYLEMTLSAQLSSSWVSAVTQLLRMDTCVWLHACAHTLGAPGDYLYLQSSWGVCTIRVKSSEQMCVCRFLPGCEMLFVLKVSSCF